MKKLIQILGQLSWRFSSDRVVAAVTQQGGQLGPVSFKLGRRTIEPFSVAPWAEEKISSHFPPVLKTLRGDFFCMPFGGNETPYRGECHPAHGETANSKWKFEQCDESPEGALLHLSLRTRVRAGRVDKMIGLRRGHTALYCKHRISGMKGPMSFGHHPMLKFPAAPGSGHISTSPILCGEVFAGPLENPAQRGYSILKPGARFTSLDRVPMIDGKTADLTRYPAREGYEDVVMLASRPDVELAWTAVTFPGEGYVWFSLKDPRVLTSTVFWHSNGGRHYAPWNGRHRGVLGVEEVTSRVSGLAASAKANSWSRAGIPAVISMNPKKPLSVNYIMAVQSISKNFDRVKKIVPGDGSVTLIAESGARVSAPLDVSFLQAE